MNNNNLKTDNTEQNLYDILRNSSGFKERLKSFLNEFKWEKQNQIKIEKI